MLRAFNSRPAQAAGPGWIYLVLFFGVFALKFQESDLLVDGLFSLNYGPGGLRYSPLCSGPREGSPETADPRRSRQQVQGGRGVQGERTWSSGCVSAGSGQGLGGGEVGETLGHGGGQLAGRELALEKKARHPHPVAERLWEIVLSS